MQSESNLNNSNTHLSTYTQALSLLSCCRLDKVLWDAFASWIAVVLLWWAISTLQNLSTLLLGLCVSAAACSLGESMLQLWPGGSYLKSLRHTDSHYANRRISIIDYVDKSPQTYLWSILWAGFLKCSQNKAIYSS